MDALTSVGSTPTGLIGGIGIRWRDADTMRWWTCAAVGGSALAVVLAAIGGLPFDIPMPTHAAGWVEPTCGLTRGSTAIARGDFGLAWRYNPAAFLVAVAGLGGIARAVTGLATGRWVVVMVRPKAGAWVVFVALFLLLWWYQQGNAEFVINSRR